MPTTSNFGWTTPADTDLVKDGAAAIRTLGNGVDASFVDLKGGTTGQVLAKASNTDLDFTWTADASGIPATIFDAKGDIIAASAADTAARLAVGTNGQYLSADSSTATGLKWVAAPAAGSDWTLVNTGGTTMTGAATITVSGISNADKIFIAVQNCSSASASSYIGIRFNADTTQKYKTVGGYVGSESTYSASNSQQIWTDDSYFYCARMSSTASSIVSLAALFNACNSTGIKVGTITGGGNTASSSGNEQYFAHGFYSGTSTISSVSIFSTSGNFDTGTLYVYTSA